MGFTEQIGQPVTFSAFYTASGLGKTGLVNAGTVNIDVYNPSGTQVVTGSVVTEIGDGWYSYALSGSSTLTAGTYYGVFKSSDVTCDTRHISDKWAVGNNWVSNLDQAVSSRSTLTAGGVWGYTNRNLTDYGLVLSTPITVPTVNVTGGGATGGSLQAGAYYLKYTQLTIGGESLPGPESIQFTVASTNIPQVTLPALPAGCIGMNIYLTQAGGASGTETLYVTGVTTTTTNLTNATVTGNQPPPTRNMTNSLIGSIWSATVRTLTSFNFGVTVTTNNDKSGYNLASTGLDSISAADPGSVANTTSLAKMIVAVWRYLYCKVVSSNTALTTYGDNGTTVDTVMTVQSDGTTITRNKGN